MTSNPSSTNAETKRFAKTPTLRPGMITLIGCLSAWLSTGCADSNNKADPYEKTNRFTYNVNDGVDRVALKPISDLYVKVIPTPIRDGLGNGFTNLSYFYVVFNDLLQGKYNQGMADFGRMAVNSTVGVLGIFDVATPWHLPAHRNDFGLTLAGWGAGQGPYLVLPILGPSTFRDAPGAGVSICCTPTTWLGLPFYIWGPLDFTDAIDTRSRLNNLTRFRSQVAIDPYLFTRNAYLQYRNAEIGERLHQKPATQPASAPSGLYDENFDDPAMSPPPATRAVK